MEGVAESFEEACAFSRRECRLMFCAISLACTSDSLCSVLVTQSIPEGGGGRRGDKEGEGRREWD